MKHACQCYGRPFYLKLSIVTSIIGVTSISCKTPGDSSHLVNTATREFGEATYVDSDGHDEAYWIAQLVSQAHRNVKKYPRKQGEGGHHVR